MRVALLWNVGLSRAGHSEWLWGAHSMDYRMSPDANAGHSLKAPQRQTGRWPWSRGQGGTVIQAPPPGDTEIHLSARLRCGVPQQKAPVEIKPLKQTVNFKAPNRDKWFTKICLQWADGSGCLVRCLRHEGEPFLLTLPTIPSYIFNPFLWKILHDQQIKPKINKLPNEFSRIVVGFFLI